MSATTTKDTEHGCTECRDLFGWETAEQLPMQLEPADAVIDDAGEWARPFRRCRGCRAWWSLSFNPKDGIHVQTPVASSVERALRSAATLDQAWPFLFARAPIDEQFERYLWAGHYDPADCLRRLLDELRGPAPTPLRHTDVLRMLVRLLSLNNPHHEALRQTQGWVWRTPERRAFTTPLLALEERLRTGGSAWSAHAGYAEQNLRDLRALLERDRSGRRRIFDAGTPDLG